MTRKWTDNPLSALAQEIRDMSDAALNNLLKEQGTEPNGLAARMQNTLNSLIVKGAREHSGGASHHEPEHSDANVNRSAGILDFPARNQLPDDPFKSLSAEDIERVEVDPDRSDDRVDEWEESQRLQLAAAANADVGIPDVVRTNLVIVAGEAVFPVWKSSAAMPVVYIEDEHLPVGASAIRLDGYRFLISDDAKSSLSVIVGCKIALLEALASADSKNGRRNVEAEIETKA